VSAPLISIAVVLFLILFEAVFVAAEIALVSLREGQVRSLSETGGKRGQRVARLVKNPNRFLGAVQLGVTLTALLAGAFGAITLSDQLREELEQAGLHGWPAHALGFVIVELVITYFTIVVGELVPKRLALQRTQGTALLLAPSLDRLATLSRPVIWLFSVSTDGLVRLLGGDPNVKNEAISEEELRGLVASHESLGPDERRLIDEVFAARQSALREVMTPRTEVIFLPATTSVSKAIEETADMPHSRYPVVGESTDEVVGFVHVRDLLAPERSQLRVGQLARPIKMFPASLNVLTALSELRREGHHLAIVADEYGGTAGIITLEDLIEEVIGDIRDEYDVVVPELGPTVAGGEQTVDALLNLDEFREKTGVTLPEGPYETAAGFVMASLGHLPQTGESIGVPGWLLTVLSLDGRRVERLAVMPIPAGNETVDDIGDTEPVAKQGAVER
jgi:putative hemolysin